MLFKDTFYTINQESLSEDSAEFSLTLNSDHDIFAGHFPGNPITPGVVQMEMVKELLSHSKQKELKLASVSNCKFLKVLNPIECPTIELSMNYTLQEDESFKVSAQLTSKDDVYLKLSASYY